MKKPWEAASSAEEIAVLAAENAALRAEVERAYGDAETYRAALNRAEAVENRLVAELEFVRSERDRFRDALEEVRAKHT